MKADLSESQVKALLKVASKSRPRPPAPYLDLLDQATKATTTVQELAGIKAHAKVLLKDPPDNRHRDAARLLYHVTVAAAFVRHGAAISDRPMRNQQDVYEKLAVTWAGHPIGELFREAARRVAGTESPE
jgi:hypothetical protein